MKIKKHKKVNKRTISNTFNTQTTARLWWQPEADR